MGIHVNIYKSGDYDCTAGGESSYVKGFTVVNAKGPFDPCDDYPAAVIVKQKFGFGSAYLIFQNSEPVAAFKANTRDKVIDVTDYEGSEKGWRIVKEFAWEHQMPLKTELRIGGKRRK